MGAVKQMRDDQRQGDLDAINSWAFGERARQLLAEMDAAERMADRWYQWGDVSRAFSNHAADIESELDNLRHDVIEPFANASGFPIYSEEWWEANELAESEAPPVDQVMKDARRLRMGDSILEQAA